MWQVTRRERKCLNHSTDKLPLYPSTSSHYYGFKSVLKSSNIPEGLYYDLCHHWETIKILGTINFDSNNRIGKILWYKKNTSVRIFTLGSIIIYSSPFTGSLTRKQTLQEKLCNLEEGRGDPITPATEQWLVRAYWSTFKLIVFKAKPESQTNFREFSHFHWWDFDGNDRVSSYAELLLCRISSLGVQIIGTDIKFTKLGA